MPQDDLITDYSISEIVQKTQVTARQLYYWEATGLIKPHYQRCGQRLFRRYDQIHFEKILEIKAWLGLGYSLEGVRRLQTSHAEDLAATEAA